MSTAAAYAPNPYAAPAVYSPPKSSAANAAKGGALAAGVFFALTSAAKGYQGAFGTSGAAGLIGGAIGGGIGGVVVGLVTGAIYGALGDAISKK